MDATVGTMLAQGAERFGERTAVVFVDTDAGTETAVSYADLNRRANRVANGLLDAGVEKGDPVAIHSYNSVPFLETFFATQKIGAVVAPINARHGASDVDYVIGDADPVCLVADADLLGAVEDDGLTAHETLDVYTFGGDDHAAYDALRGSDADPGVTVSGDDADGYYYTSGSTGRPKGVRHSHADRVFVCANVVSELGVRRTDVNVMPLPLFHSGPLYTGFVPFLQFGVPTVLFDQFDAEATLRAIGEHDATILGGVPTIYDRLVALLEDDPDAHDVSSLRFWWVSGAVLADSLRERAREVLGERYSNIYGATEVGPPVSILPPECCDGHEGSCGNGVENQSLRLVDPDGERDPEATVAAGETGEVAVRGESVMDGYRNLPEKTAQRLVDGWYFMGDLARRDADGYLYVEGRKDDMIISGGENIYPAEVEDALLRHPDVEDVAVIGVDHEKWGQTPKAFIEVRAGATLTAADVETFCRESDLAGYKRPRRVAFVEEIPRSESGTALREELRAMD